MDADDRSDWRCTGLRWGPDGPVLLWLHPERGEGRGRPGVRGEPALVAVGERRCTGVWCGGRRTPCPTAAVVPVTGTSAQCPDCRRLDRSMSVAADTRADDQQPYAVYLAWFGPGLLKVGITAAARGTARLLEQGAVAFTMLGRGPLMTARRTEDLLGRALGVRDRVAYSAKRAARVALPPVDRRFEELAALHRRAVALPGLPGSLDPLPFAPVDHGEAFGLDRLTAAVQGGRDFGTVTHLEDGAVVAGELLGAAGPDLHLRTGGGVLAVDTRLMAGWVLRPASPGARTTAPARPVTAPAGSSDAGAQEGLF